MSRRTDSLFSMIERGMRGENRGIPVGLERFNTHLCFRKSVFTLLFSSSGAGKSAFLDYMILNACDVAKRFNYPLKIILFSMERKSEFRIAKWISRKIFLEEGLRIPIKRILGWEESAFVSEEEYSLIKKYKEYIDDLLTNYVEIHDGSKSPDEICNILQKYYDNNGEYSQVINEEGETVSVYKANNESLITIGAIDHINITKKGKFFSKKDAIDNLVESLQGFRDLEGLSPFVVTQINRDLNSQIAKKDISAEPSTENIKDSSTIEDAADVIVSLFDPIKYQQSSPTKYNPIDFVNTRTGGSYFRSMQLLKSSYGESGGRVPLAFNGFCGDYRVLPRRNDIDDDEYKILCESVLNESYFLENNFDNQEN